MRYGIQITYKNKKSDWCLQDGRRIEFDDMNSAQSELNQWRQKGWWPSTVSYKVKELL